MLSICPGCKNQLEHEDFLFEVVCPTCKLRFNPFMQQNNAANGIDGMNAAGAEPASMMASGTDNFSESKAVFQELRQYGETLEEAPSATASDSGSASENMPAIPGMSFAPADACTMTSGGELQGYSIDAYLPPVSVWADVDVDAQNPLGAAFDQLGERAKSTGGNGLLGLRWELSKDASKVLVSGVPVHCNKNG